MIGQIEAVIEYVCNQILEGCVVINSQQVK